MTPACQPAIESSFTLQWPTTQAARILASSLSRVMQRDTLQVPRARRGVQPAHPKRGATESSQGGAALYCSSAWEERRGVVSVFLAEQRPALPPSGRGGHREASRARRLGGCHVPGRRTPGIRWVGGFGTHCWQCYHFSSHALRPLRGPSASCTGVPVLHDPLLSWRDWSCQFVYPPLLGIPIDFQALGCATLKSTVLQGAGEGCVDTPSRRLPLLAKKHTSLCLHIALCLQVKVAQIQPSAQFHLSLPVTEPTMLSN